MSFTRLETLLLGGGTSRSGKRLVIDACDEIDRLRSLCERLSRDRFDALERVTELEAKTMALNHPDLEPGLLVHLVVEGSVPLHCGDDLENWGAGRIVGWLPWPDHRGEGVS